MSDNIESTAVSVCNQKPMTMLQVAEHFDAIKELGKIYAQAGAFGQVSPSAATAAIVNCFFEGISPAQYKGKYHTFEDGTTSIRSDYYQRTFHRLGGDWEFVEWNSDRCEMLFTYRGKSLKMIATIGEFVDNGVAVGKNGQIKTNWKKFPREMLKARCMATAIRALCPEAMEGFYAQEEVADFDRPSAIRVAEATVSPSPIDSDVRSEDVETVDYDVCPCGSVKGRRWSEVQTEMLKKILATPESRAKSLTAEHRNAIINELESREADVEQDDEPVEEIVDFCNNKGE